MLTPPPKQPGIYFRKTLLHKVLTYSGFCREIFSMKAFATCGQGKHFSQPGECPPSIHPGFQMFTQIWHALAAACENSPMLFLLAKHAIFWWWITWYHHAIQQPDTTLQSKQPDCSPRVWTLSCVIRRRDEIIHLGCPSSDQMPCLLAQQPDIFGEMAGGGWGVGGDGRKARLNFF